MTEQQTEQPQHPDQIELARRLVYLAAERTLSGWIRTALSLMALGFVMDRFDLVLRLGGGRTSPAAHMLSNFGGSVIIGLGALMALAAGIRYWRFAWGYSHQHSTEVRNSLLVGAGFSLLLALFGVGLIVGVTWLLR